MDKKFTPGPWETSRGLIFFPKIAGGFSVRECPDAAANANLIAAAPELLEALEGLLLLYTSIVDSGDCGFWNPEEDEDVIEAREAINKAYGETK